MSLRRGRVFQSKSFAKTIETNTIAARYRRGLKKHPFVLFGLPFITTIVAGSFFLTPATALRYERHDRKVQQMSKDEAMGLGKDRRKVDMREEYYVSTCLLQAAYTIMEDHANWTMQRLQAKDLDNWEQKRVKRLPGEVDGVLE